MSIGPPTGSQKVMNLLTWNLLQAPVTFPWRHFMIGDNPTYLVGIFQIWSTLQVSNDTAVRHNTANLVISARWHTKLRMNMVNVAEEQIATPISLVVQHYHGASHYISAVSLEMAVQSQAWIRDYAKIHEYVLFKEGLLTPLGLLCPFIIRDCTLPFRQIHQMSTGFLSSLNG